MGFSIMHIQPSIFKSSDGLCYSSWRKKLTTNKTIVTEVCSLILRVYLRLTLGYVQKRLHFYSLIPSMESQNLCCLQRERLSLTLGSVQPLFS